MPNVRVIEPLTPRAWKLRVPVGVPAVVVTVSVLVALPLAGRTTEAGAYPHVVPKGRLAQSSDTSPANPTSDVTVHVLVRAPPPVGNDSDDGLQAIVNSDSFVGVAVTQELAADVQAVLEPTAMTL